MLYIYTDCTGLNRINRLMYYETSYQNQFPGYWFQQDDVNNNEVQNVLILPDDSTTNNTTTQIQTDQTQKVYMLACFNLSYTQISRNHYLK